jgi:hypothetical protein
MTSDTRNDIAQCYQYELFKRRHAWREQRRLDGEGPGLRMGAWTRQLGVL